MNIDTVATVAIFVALGYFPARLATGSAVFAIVFAPVTSALLLGLTVTVGVALRLPATPMFLVAAAASTACGVVILARATPRPTHETALGASMLPLLFPLLALLPLASLRRGPIEHDFRTIWSMHGKWVTSGGDAMADAMQNSAFAFAHPDYPPLAPGAIGAARWLGGTDSLRLAQVVVAVLTLGAVSALGFAVWWVVRRRGAALAFAVGATATLAAYGAASATSVLAAPGTSGYVDLLWAACYAAAVVFLLAAPVDDASTRFGALCLAAAALTKNEGATAALLLAVIAAVRHRGARGHWWWLASALVPAALWSVVSAALGASTLSQDAPGNARLGDLITLDPDITARVGPTLRALWHFSWPFVVVGALVTVLGMLSVRDERARITGSGAPWSWLAWAGATGSIALAFVVTGAEPPPLLSAPDRTSIAGNLVLLTEVLLWGAVALGMLVDRTRDVRQPGSPADRRSRAGTHPLVPPDPS